MFCPIHNKIGICHNQKQKDYILTKKKKKNLYFYLSQKGNEAKCSRENGKEKKKKTTVFFFFIYIGYIYIYHIYEEKYVVLFK